MDAIVIGAGLGGLAAAIELGTRGLRATVLEARDDVGGKAGVALVDGLEVDTGPSLLTLRHVFDTLLRRAGTALEDEVSLRQPDPWFEHRWPDGVRLVLPHTQGGVLDEVRRVLGPSAAAELGTYLAHAARIWEAAAPHFVMSEAPSITRVLGMGLRAVPMLARIDPLRTLRASIARHVREPHLRDLLERFATYNGSDPRSAPATLGCIAHVELGMGAWGIDGGVRALVLALQRVAERQGALVRTGARAVRVIVEAGRVRGVELASGERLMAPLVIANADPAHVLGGLVEGAHAPRLAPSMSGWTAIVRARRRPRAAHTVLYSGDYDAELRDIFDSARAPLRPTIYVCAQEPAHGRHGWEDDEPLFVMTNAPPEPASGASELAWWERTRVEVSARLRASGVTSEGDRVLWERGPRELAAAFPGTRGALYGSGSSSMASAFLRPSNEVRSVPGLFLASGGAHPGGGMPLATLSGVEAARAATAFLARAS